MSTMTAEPGTRRKPAVSFGWSAAGFGRHDAAEWRQAGWGDPHAAAEWSAACPDDSPDLLHQLRESGYSIDQLRQTARVARRHVAAWTAALVRPADAELYIDADGNTVIDLR